MIGWRGGVPPVILNLGLDGGECSASLLGRFTPTEEPRSLNGRMSVPQSRSRRYGNEKYLLSLPECEPRIIQTVQNTKFRGLRTLTKDQSYLFTKECTSDFLTSEQCNLYTATRTYYSSYMQPHHHHINHTPMHHN